MEHAKKDCRNVDRKHHNLFLFLLLRYFLAFWGLCGSILSRTAEGLDRRWGRARERHAAKDHRVESNPRPLQREHMPLYLEHLLYHPSYQGASRQNFSLKGIVILLENDQSMKKKEKVPSRGNMLSSKSSTKASFFLSQEETRYSVIYLFRGGTC